MGAAWTRHTMCESAFNIQFEKLKIQNVFRQTEEGVKSAAPLGSGNSKNHQNCGSS